MLQRTLFFFFKMHTFFEVHCYNADSVEILVRKDVEVLTGRHRRSQKYYSAEFQAKKTVYEIFSRSVPFYQRDRGIYLNTRKLITSGACDIAWSKSFRFQRFQATSSCLITYAAICAKFSWTGHNYNRNYTDVGMHVYQV